MMFKAVASVMLLALAACTSGRVATANEAQSQMIGMSKEQILRCMGPPHSSYVVGSSTEVWAYNSAAQNASAAPACIVNVMMQDSQVIDIDYRPIGGFLKRTSSAPMPSRNASTGGNPQLPALGVKANLRLQPISGYNVESRTAEMIEAGLLTDSSGDCSNGL
jgi:outer membrane protein assembly factor BamE (lipoprotein component of BamABCDE complex)